MKSEYTANAYLSGLTALEREISRNFEPGYDPYNSMDRPVLVHPYSLEIREPTPEDRARRSAPHFVVTIPAVLGLGPLEPYVSDDAFEYDPTVPDHEHTPNPER